MNSLPEPLRRFKLIELITAQSPTNECILWPYAKSRKGYGMCSIKKPTGKYGGAQVHRLAYEYFVGDPGELLVCHHCDVRLCINPVHLFLGTNQDNKDDCVKKNRQSRGERCALSKTTAADVLEMRRLNAEQGLSARALAKIFPLSRGGIISILNRDNWKHI